MAKISENSLVEKSRFLIGMQAPDYELGELQILDTYLARINARDPKTQAVTFTKEEYESLMGLIDSRPETLIKRTKGLLGKVVTIPRADGKKGWTQLTLFTKAECIQDDYGGYVVNLKCNPDLESVFFNIEEVGYLRYRLKNILPLTSKHSMLMYIYFKDNLFRKTFEVDLKQFRETLGVHKMKTYESFKYFKRDVLDKGLLELNEKTDIKVSYERKTRGKLTTGLIFTVSGKAVEIPKLPELPAPVDSDEPEQLGLEAMSDDADELTDYGFWRSALPDDQNVTDDQIDLLLAAAKLSHWYGTIPEDYDAYDRKQLLHTYFRRQDVYVRAHGPRHSYVGYMRAALAGNHADVEDVKPIDVNQNFDTDDFFNAAVARGKTLPN